MVSLYFSKPSSLLQTMMLVYRNYRQHDTYSTAGECCTYDNATAFLLVPLDFTLAHTHTPLGISERPSHNNLDVPPRPRNSRWLRIQALHLPSYVSRGSYQQDNRRTRPNEITAHFRWWDSRIRGRGSLG